MLKSISRRIRHLRSSSMAYIMFNDLYYIILLYNTLILRITPLVQFVCIIILKCSEHSLWVKYLYWAISLLVDDENGIQFMYKCIILKYDVYEIRTFNANVSQRSN